MGFFSWKTQDTDRSICNLFSSRTPFRVKMTDDKGNQWTEDNYEGYGVFDGKDYYALLDEMNGGNGDRQIGIDREFNPAQYPNTIYPSLTENGMYYDGKQPESCDAQGYFYFETEEDDEIDPALDEEWDEESGAYYPDKDDIDPAGGHGLHSHE